MSCLDSRSRTVIYARNPGQRWLREWQTDRAKDVSPLLWQARTEEVPGEYIQTGWIRTTRPSQSTSGFSRARANLFNRVFFHSFICKSRVLSCYRRDQSTANWTLTFWSFYMRDDIITSFIFDTILDLLSFHTYISVARIPKLSIPLPKINNKQRRCIML